MNSSYWAQFSEGRISRRRTVGMMVGGAAAAILAACGGGSSKGNSGDSGGGGSKAKDSSGLLTTPELTTKNAVGGGTWQYFLTADVDHFDPMDAQRGVLTNVLNTYSQPIKYKSGTTDSPPDGSFVGDAAESWDISPDGLQITFKLRQNVKLDPRPPTNGRLLDADDWVYSWNTFAAKAPAASELSAKRNPDSPVESWTNPDKKTVVIKLAYPYAPILSMISDSRYSFVLVPVEHDGKYNAHNETRGSGPFFLQRWDPSSRVEYRKNPNFWDSPRPYLDGIDQPIVTEYAQRLAQFKAGNLWYADIRQEDVLPARKDNGKLKTWLFPVGLTVPSSTAFSSRPTQPFGDIRVRKGLSMLVDREALNDLNYNIAKFATEGIKLDVKQHTLVSAGDNRFWVDYKNLGDGAKNFQYNPDEAAKLLKAAGISNQPLPVNVRMTTAGAVAITPQVQALASMFDTGGFFKSQLITLNPADSNTLIHRGRGLGYDGVALYGGGSAADPDLTLTRYYSTSEFTMFSGKLPYDDLFQQQRRELDLKKRQDLWKQIQVRWAAEITDFIGPIPGLAPTLRIAWPYFQNFDSLVFWNTLVDTQNYYWYDKSKA